MIIGKRSSLWILVNNIINKQMIMRNVLFILYGFIFPLHLVDMRKILTFAWFSIISQNWINWELIDLTIWVNSQKFWMNSEMMSTSFFWCLLVYRLTVSLLSYVNKVWEEVRKLKSLGSLREENKVWKKSRKFLIT